MIFAISKFIANLFGLDISRVQRYVFWAVVLLGLLAVLILVIGIKSCISRPPKLNEQEIQKGEQAVKERNDKELREILTNSDVREKQIDANVAYAENRTVQAIQESKEKYSNMTTDELAAELEKRK